MELAYIFWHHRRHAASEDNYRSGLNRFHESLAEYPPKGFISSFSRRYTTVPWLEASVEVYEDWYIVDNFGALDPLNDAATRNAHEESHEGMSKMVEKGTAGVYKLWFNFGSEAALKTVVWFDKPPLIKTDEFLESIERKTSDAGGILWRRQMNLGPAKEFVVWLPSDKSFLIEDSLQFPFNRI